MNIPEAAILVLKEIKTTPHIEWTAIFFAVCEVLLARYNNVLLYPCGIISTVIYTYIFLQPDVKLYADAILNSYYFIMSVYGWILWSKNKTGNAHLEITPNNKRDWIITISIAILGWGLLYLLLSVIFPIIIPAIFRIKYVVSDVAVWDAFISATAWSGMWLLAKRKIENWLLLNVSNLVAIPILIYKGMRFTACLTLFLFIVAIFGYLEWKKSYSARHLKFT